MDLPVLTRIAYDRNRRIQFRAAVLSAATTHRPGVGRWTELTVYRVPIGEEEPPAGVYVLARVGRSVLAHRGNCEVVNVKRMAAIATDPEAARRMPCLDCMPPLAPPDPDVVVERTKHQLLRVRSTQELGNLVFPRRTSGALTGMTADTVGQLCSADPDFDQWWSTVVAPYLTWE